MDKQKFDALTRAFATGTSRRTAIKGIFGGAVGVAVASTHLDRAGAQATCETVEDCGAQPDSCTVWECNGGICETSGGCPGGEYCCPAQGGSCAECCTDAECAGGTYCYNPGDPSDAYCVQCVSDDDCAQPDACTNAACIDNICSTASACPAGETCCDVDGAGIDCVNLNAPGDQYCGACGIVCGPCETCNNGVCVSTCTGCEVCDSGTCIEDCGECSVCDSGTCIATECCYDSDCPDCYFCSEEGTCVENLCLIGEECCYGECVPNGECCQGVGDYCGLLEVTSADDSPQYDCCDGLVCCHHGDSMTCAECCNDWDCSKGAYCNHGWCDWPEEECDHDKDCPKGTCCCKDGSCSGKCCDHHPHHPKPHKPVKPAPTPDVPVTTLPATGAGSNDERNTLLGTAALGAAAAVLAARKLRETPEA